MERDVSQDRDFEVLVNFNRQEWEQKAKEDVLDLVCLLHGTLMRYVDQIYGPREAAEMFDKRKTWIYDALNRPRTPLQFEIAAVVIRSDKKLIQFRRSDLVVIRNRIFDGETFDA